MCGIAGIYQSKLGPEETNLQIEKMTTAIRRRGPDGEGKFVDHDIAFGHRRLAIIDPTDSGLQPMRRGHLTITFNGEIYNFQEKKNFLISKGLSFSTQTDTEVVLALYEYFSLDFVHHLDGIFAFALYDHRQKTLVCVRDPYGVKPFLYTQNARGFFFASEMKAILAGGLIEKKINERAMAELLSKGSIRQPMTLVENVNWLMPGRMMICKGSYVETTDYFKLSQRKAHPVDEKNRVEQFESELTQSIHEQMLSDVPLGAFLSGGIDSSLIVALMKKKQTDIQTFSVGFDPKYSQDQYSESSDAMQVAKHLQTNHHEIMLEDNSVKPLLRDFVRDLDHPSIDGLNSYLVSQAAASKLKVALSGTGSDEILGGYSWFQTMQKYECRSWVSKFKDAVKGLDFNRRYGQLHSVFSDLNVLAGDLGRFKPNSVSEDPFEFSETLKRVSGFVITGYLRNQLLADIDTTSMACGLEVRVPYLKPSLVDLALNLPREMRVSSGEIGYPPDSYAGSGVKKILIEIGKKHLPEDFPYRQKRGFSLPMKSWIKSIWFDELRELLSEETVSRRGLFNVNQVSNLQNRFLEGQVPWTQVWLLMVIELWFQEIFDNSK